MVVLSIFVGLAGPLYHFTGSAADNGTSNDDDLSTGGFVNGMVMLV